MLAGGRRFRRRQGAAAVELALLLPPLCFSVLVAVDIGRCFQCASAVTERARNGAAAALAADVGPTGLDKAIRDGADAASADLPPPRPPITWTSGTDSEGLSYIEVTATYTYVGIVGDLWGFTSATIVRTVRMPRPPIPGL